MPTALPRNKVKLNQTWNAESLFPSPEAFDMEVNSLVESLAEIRKFHGRLGENPDIFLESMDTIEVISQRAAKVRVYASMSSAVDATDQQAVAMSSKATSALAQVSAATSFVDPELLRVGSLQLDPQ